MPNANQPPNSNLGNNNKGRNIGGNWQNTYSSNGKGGTNSVEQDRNRRGPHANIGGRNRNSGGPNINNSNSRPGDWSCTKCGANNFAHRTKCFKCNNLKDGSKINPDPKGSQNLSTINPNLRGNPNLSPISDEIKLIKLLQKAKSVAETIEQHIEVYMSAWKQCRQLSQPQLETLIVSVGKLPASFVFEIPPLASHCRMAAECYINFEEKNKTDADFKEAVLPKIKNIVNFVKVYSYIFVIDAILYLCV